MNVEKGILQLSVGKQAEFEYDVDGDLLEIYFQRGNASCTVELTDDIVLRFDWEKVIPLSLALMSASHIMQPAEFGDVYFELMLQEYSKEIQDKLLRMLRTSPLNEILQIASFAPAHSHKMKALATIKHSPQFAIAA